MREKNGIFFLPNGKYKLKRGKKEEKGREGESGCNVFWLFSHRLSCLLFSWDKFLAKVIS